jgi:hypothetical protein
LGDAEEKFKELASAYGLVGDAEKRKRFDSGEIDAAGAERPPRQNYYKNCASSEQDHPYADNSGFADFVDSEDAFAELLRRSARAQANRRGHLPSSVRFGDAEDAGLYRHRIRQSGDDLYQSRTPAAVVLSSECLGFVSSITDLVIASTLAIGGIAMTPLSALVVVSTLAATVSFSVMLDCVKVPIFRRLGIT